MATRMAPISFALNPPPVLLPSSEMESHKMVPLPEFCLPFWIYELVVVARGTTKRRRMRLFF